VIFLLYIKNTKDYLEYFDEECTFPDFIKKIIFAYKKFLGKITMRKSNCGEVWLIPENSLKFKKKLLKNLDIYEVKTLVLAKDLANLKPILEEKNIRVLNGKWLYKYLMLDIVKYASESKGERLEDQIVSFMVRNPKEADFENFKLLAESCRGVNLICKEDYRFRRQEEMLYKEKGIIVNNSYNYKKSLLKSAIIINVDFPEKEYNKFAFPRKAIMVNLEDVKVYSKGFNGINILNFEIDFPEKYEDELVNLSSFDKEILYESIVYKKTAMQNILKQIKQDKVKITKLIGKSGYIDEKEFAKV